MENLHILQDFVPYWGRCPKTISEQVTNGLSPKKWFLNLIGRIYPLEISKKKVYITLSKSLDFLQKTIFQAFMVWLLIKQVRSNKDASKKILF